MTHRGLIRLGRCSACTREETGDCHILCVRASHIDLSTFGFLTQNRRIAKKIRLIFPAPRLPHLYSLHRRRCRGDIFRYAGVPSFHSSRPASICRRENRVHRSHPLRPKLQHDLQQFPDVVNTGTSRFLANCPTVSLGRSGSSTADPLVQPSRTVRVICIVGLETSVSGQEGTKWNAVGM